jgi:hypothetical protein
MWDWWVALRLPTPRWFLLHLAGLCVLVSFVSTLSPSDRFALTTSALCRAVAACLGRGLMNAAMIVLVWQRVRRAEGLFLALVERVRSGRFRGGWVRSGVAASGRSRETAGLHRGRLPLRFCWLMGVMPYEAAGYAGQMRTVLAEPEMAALLRDVPQARRILGPVCRMLGVEIPGPRPLPRAEATVADGAAADGAVAASGRTRVTQVREVADLGRVPLPRGVLAAARRQGFGKVRFGKGG